MNRKDNLQGLSFLDSVIENIPHMIFVKDAKELRFVRFNKAGEDLIGYTKNDMIGKNDYDFFIKREADFLLSLLLKQGRSGNFYRIRKEGLAGDSLGFEHRPAGIFPRAGKRDSSSDHDFRQLVPTKEVIA